MRISRGTLDTCPSLEGTVVIIDVLRAFTTACYAFQAGVTDVVFAGTVDDAFRLKKRFPGSLILGEIDGFPVAGFDLPNSPSALPHWDLSGVRLIQRTTAGSQGVLRSKKASGLLAACLCNLTATASHLHMASPSSITLVLTGLHPGGWGDEDVACADAIETLLQGRSPDLPQIVKRVTDSRAGRHYTDPENPVFPASDLRLALQVDRYPYPLGITRKPSCLVMRPIVL